MRRTLIVVASVVALFSVGFAVPGSAQTETTGTTRGEIDVDSLQITGSVVCTSSKTYEITWTLQNASATEIAFYQMESLLDGVTVEVLSDLSPIEPGGSRTVVTNFPGGSRGQAVLQTEAYFADDVETAGPVPGVVVLDGSCVAPAAVAPRTEARPSFTG